MGFNSGFKGLIFLSAGVQKYLFSNFPVFNWPHSWQLAYEIDHLPRPSLLGHNFVTPTTQAGRSSEVSMFLSEPTWCQTPDRYEMVSDSKSERVK